MMKDSKGFTLIELLIAMSLAGLVFGIVTTAFVVTLGASTDSEQQLLQSQAENFSSAYIVQDVTSATTTLAPSTANCTAQPGSAVLATAWTDVTTDVKVDYRFDSSTGNLTRYEWRGSPCTATPTTTLIGTSLQNAQATALPAINGRAGIQLIVTGRLGASKSINAYRRLA